MSKPTAEQLIPDEFQYRLQQLGYQADSSEWAIGDLVSILEDECPGVPKFMLHNAAGQYCKRAGATVRDYVYVSRRVPCNCPGKCVRHDFDVLGRHHHKAICDYAQGNIDLHREICEKWLALADNYGGGIGPVHALRTWLENDQEFPNPWVEWLKTIRKHAEKIGKDEDAPQKLRSICRKFGDVTKEYL